MPYMALRNMPRRTRGLAALLGVLWILGTLNLGGCALFDREPLPQSDDVLIQQGIEAFNSGSYKRSIELFQAVKDRFPFSRHVLLAEQKIADAHYLREEYPEAIYAYQDFEKLHPRNPVIPYIIYQIGMCYFKQMPDIDQDQEVARKAAAEFDRLIKTYPNSPYAIRGENRLNESLNHLARYEMYVGKFYYVQKKYEAARARFQGVIRNFPDQGEYREALRYLDEIEQRQARVEEKQRESQETDTAESR